MFSKEQIVYFGSVILNGKAVSVGEPYKASYREIQIMDTVPDNEIPWIWTGEKYMAAACVCVCISWDKLDTQGYMKGRPVTIGGRNYICRVPTVGQGDGRFDNDWDQAMLRIGDENELWNWNHVYSWGREEWPGLPQYKMVRGNTKAGALHQFNASLVRKYIGFRPVLEPVPLKISDDLVGRDLQLSILGKEYPIRGQLLELTDYDLFFKPSRKYMDLEGWGIQLSDGNLAIARKTVQKAINNPII